MNVAYDDKFYREMDKFTANGARAVLPILKEVLPQLRSAVDVGCGVGTWLSVLRELGVDEVLGLDGPWVEKRYLRIPEDCFIECDLTNEVQLDRRFDLAISCEVAEHLPEDSAKGFVNSLCRLSDFVLFSAAIPHQGGVNHINEQWPTYWLSMFEAQGYVALDVVRKRIWNDSAIAGHYRQNILLFVKIERTADLCLQLNLADTIPPERYLLTYGRLTSPGIRQSVSALGTSIRRRFGW